MLLPEMSRGACLIPDASRKVFEGAFSPASLLGLEAARKLALDWAGSVLIWDVGPGLAPARPPRGAAPILKQGR
jgi:hypothetical protein